jgi:hypothetical protein
MRLMTRIRAALAPQEPVAVPSGRDRVATVTRSIDYAAYATEHRLHRLWIDRLLDRFPLPGALAAIAVGATLYVVGGAIALAWAFLDTYLATPAVYLGCVGFALFLVIANAVSVRFHPALELLRPVFDVDDTDYHGRVLKSIRRFTDVSASLVWVGTWFVVVVGLIVAAYATSAETRRDLGIVSLRPDLFPSEWYTMPNRVPALVLLVFYAVAVAAAVGTGTRLLVVNLRFLWSLRSLELIPMPALVRARLRPLTTLYVWISLTWSAGVALFGILFYGHYDVMAGALIATLFVVGALTFLVPQLVWSTYVARSYERVCESALVFVHQALGAGLRERTSREPPESGVVAETLADVAELTRRPSAWVYESRDVMLWLVAQLVTAGAAIAALLAQR